jgi:hypothetical protein
MRGASSPNTDQRDVQFIARRILSAQDAATKNERPGRRGGRSLQQISSLHWSPGLLGPVAHILSKPVTPRLTVLYAASHSPA